MKKSSFGIQCGLLIAALSGSIGGAATILDLGALSGGANSAGYGISGSGRAVGTSENRSFRTAKNTGIQNSGGDNLHATLMSLIPPVNMSRAYDIHQTSTEAMEIVGDAYDITDFRPFWYYESDSGKTKYARVLYSTKGAALAVAPDPSGQGGATAVVGNVYVNGVAHAAYWSVIPTQHWLYDYGDLYFSNQESFATGTDRNRTVGSYGTYNQGYNAYIIDNNAYALSNPSGAIGSAALGMYTSGSVSAVVGYFVSGGLEKPIYWSYMGSGQSTNRILQLPSGMTQGHANAINDYGQIVGSVWNSGFGSEVACYWYASSATPTIMNSVSGDPAWNLVRAHKITSYGSGSKIVGEGNHGSTPRGFVYTP